MQRKPCSAANESRWNQARHKRRRALGQLASPVHAIAPNLLDRQFGATGPNQKWAADFTYVWTGECWLFVAVVLDLYSGPVVGWSMQPTMTAQLVMDALLMATFRRGRPRAVLHHSDQGSQYTSEDFQPLLESHCTVCSMSHRGNCWDNAAMESFFSTLKTERLSKSTTGRGMIYVLTCSTISKGSTIYAGVIPLTAISAQYSLKT
jgi:putative transposase